KTIVALITVLYNAGQLYPYFRLHVRGVYRRVKGVYIEINAHPVQFGQVVADLVKAYRTERFRFFIVDHAYCAPRVNDQNFTHSQNAWIAAKVSTNQLDGFE